MIYEIWLISGALAALAGGATTHATGSIAFGLAVGAGLVSVNNMLLAISVLLRKK